MNKTDEIQDQYEDALVHYMTKCHKLEEENVRLKEQVKELLWQMQEQD